MYCTYTWMIDSHRLHARPCAGAAGGGTVEQGAAGVQQQEKCAGDGGPYQRMPLIARLYTYTVHVSLAGHILRIAICVLLLESN